MAGSGLQIPLIVILYAMPCLSGFVVAVRLWRKRLDRTLGGDDYTIAFAWLLGLVNSIIVHFYVLELYVGYHDQDVPKAKIDRKHAAKLQLALAQTYNPIICLVKLSFLWSLQKLRSRNIWIRRSLWAIQIINGLYLVVQFIVGMVPCLPLAKQFDKTLPGSCYSPTKFVIGTVCVVLITDLLVLIMPTWIIYDLQMALKRKLITIAFLSLGFVVIAVGILRLVWLTNKFKGKTSNHSVQQSYSAIEANIAIIGASGPTVKYLLSFFLPSLRSDFAKKSSSYGNGMSNNNNNSNRSRSKFNGNAYNDLDTIAAKHEEFEMKNDDWRWRSKMDSDSHSDEQRINTDEGITKTVDWSVSTNDHGNGSTKGSHRIAVQPADVV